MTEDDVKKIIGDALDERRGQVQWAVRAAYEEGWRDGGGDPVKSPHNEPPKGWRASWLGSSARAMLVRNGMISGDDGWK